MGDVPLFMGFIYIYTVPPSCLATYLRTTLAAVDGETHGSLLFQNLMVA